MTKCELPRPATLADANLGFAWRTFRTLLAADRTSSTTTYSPYSAATALHMVVNSADDQAEEALLAAVCFDGTLGQLNDGAKATRARLTRDHEVTIANGLWTSPAHTPTPTFREALTSGYGAEVERFGIRRSAPLNRWVTERTKGRIDRIVDDGDLNEELTWVIASAITFDGTWKERFDAPRPQPFTFGSKKFDVPMLQDQRLLDYANSLAGKRARQPGSKLRNDDFAAVRIPYDGGRFALIVVIPKATDGLDRVIQRLGPDEWRRLRSNFTPSTMHVALPVLKLNETRRIDRHLFEIGVPSGTYGEGIQEQGRPIEIEYIQQGIFLELDEHGTQAAAVIASGGGLTAGAPVGFPFRADHPYLMAIEERTTGELLFMAAIRDPRGA